ncbi:enoyl-CoA hydratase/isomerase family protein [Microbacterium sp. RD1]|uniref:enoyl-CoA hydratase/isomerase family protein n=1 Tax=Microbacterium sp. RD1 TaxID=3457313 RepID=UPI003FA5FD2A
MTIDTSIADWTGLIEVDDFSPLSRGDRAFTLALRDAVVDLADDDFVKAIVLRARDDFAPDAEPPVLDRREIFSRWQREVPGAPALYQSITFAKKVVITEVAGVCAGAGTLLVLASDLTVASEDATFGSPFRGRPEANFVQAALTIRLNRAKAWTVRGTTFDAATADEYGLVNEVVPRAQLSSASQRMAREVARMPLDGVVMSKMLLQPVLDVSGVGREYDLAGFYATGLSATEGATR